VLGRDIQHVLEEINRISQAVQEGNLLVRGNFESLSGGWRELVIGLNMLVDAFVTPITVTATYLDRIAKGDIPGTVTDEYKGDFNEIKKNMNRLIEGDAWHNGIGRSDGGRQSEN
jgi:methyl-accepting chemotaxis protein